MREMKDSGIEWIGEIPSDWELCRLKYVCDGFVNGFSGTQLNSDISDYPVSRIETISSGVVDMDKVGYVASIPERYKLNTNDFIISNINSIQYLGNFAQITDDINLYHGMNLMRVTPKQNIYANYLKWFFLSNCYRTEMQRICKPAINQASVSATNMKHIIIPMPSYETQIIISNYLNNKCNEIDALIADIQTQIETLEQYKKSLITEAVTKGLNPDVEMKDSGIEWIEKIPVTWRTTKVKYLFSSGKGLGITKENLVDEGLPVISYGQIHSKDNNGVSLAPHLLRFVDWRYKCLFPQCEVEKYDFVFADTSEDYDGCGNCVYKRDDDVVFGGYHSIVLHSKYKKDNRFLAYLFLIDDWRKQIRSYVSGVKVFSVTNKLIMNTSVVLPPEDEQCRISDYLDRKCEEINEIIKARKEQIEIFSDYKKSLIYEYVTGKKEVPNE